MGEMSGKFVYLNYLQLRYQMVNCYKNQNS